MKGLVKSYLLPLLIVLIGVGGFAALRASRPGPEPLRTEERAWTVAVENVAPATIAPSLTLYARVDSPLDARLTSAIAADVLEVPVREGWRVERGELLVALDDRELAFKARERRAEVADIEAQIGAELERHAFDLRALVHEQSQLELAKRAVERALDLSRRRVGAEAQVDEARQSEARLALEVESRRFAIRDHVSRQAQLEAKRARAEALLGQAELDLARTRIEAPFAGRVSEVFVSPGDRVQGGDSLLDLYDTDVIELRAQIPTRYVPAVRASLGRDVRLAARATVDGAAVTAELDRLTGRVERGSGGVDALFVVTSGGAWLQLGRTFELELELPPEPGAVAVPMEAVYGANRLFKLVGERLAEVVVERVGVVAQPGGGRRVLVRSPALGPGDRIVVTQLPNAIDGLRVRVAGEE